MTTTAPQRPTLELQKPEGLAGHVGVRLALLAGALAIVAMWWLDPTSVQGLGDAGHRCRTAGRTARRLPRPGPAAADGPARLVRARRRLRPADRLAPRAGHQHGAPAGRPRAADRRGLQPHRTTADVVSTGWRVLSTYPAMLKATAGLALFGLVAVTSARAARQRLTYEAWYAVHLHGLRRRRARVQPPDRRGPGLRRPPGQPRPVVGASTCSWLPCWSWGGCCCRSGPGGGTGCWSSASWSRAPAWSASGCADGGWTSSGAEAGQFLLWRFLAPGHVWSAHPYSLSAAPDHGRLRITVKDAGDHSAALAHLRPGTPVIAEGPFGHFTLDKSVGLAAAADRGWLRHRAHPRAGRGAGAARHPPPPRRGAALPRRARPGPGAARRARPPRRGGRACGWSTSSATAPSWATTRSRPRRSSDLVPDVRSRDVYVCGPAGHDAQRAAGHARAARARPAAALRRLRDGMTGPLRPPRTLEAAPAHTGAPGGRVRGHADHASAGWSGCAPQLTPPTAPGPRLLRPGRRSGSRSTRPAEPRRARRRAGTTGTTGTSRGGAATQRARGQGLRRQLRHRPGQGDHARATGSPTSRRCRCRREATPATSASTPRPSCVARPSLPRAPTSTRCRERRTPRPATPSRCSRRSTSAADEAGRAGHTRWARSCRSTYGTPVSARRPSPEAVEEPSTGSGPAARRSTRRSAPGGPTRGSAG